MTTPLDLITLAMKRSKVLGVGQVASDDDAQTALELMNHMLAQWNRKRYLVYKLQDLAKIATGAQSYTVGPAADFDTAVRPSVVEAAYLRMFPAQPTVVSGMPESVVPIGSPFVYQAGQAGVLTVTGGVVSSLQFSNATGAADWVPATSPISVGPNDAVQVVYTTAPTMVFTPTTTKTVQSPVPINAVDYPLRIFKSREDWSRVVVKGLQSFSQVAYYEPDWPLGRFYPYPYPPGSGLFELHILVPVPLTGFSSLVENIDLPPEYSAAIYLNLAGLIRSTIGGLPFDPALDKEATGARELLRAANGQIPALRMPSSLKRMRGIYNVYSDQSR